MNKKTNSTTLSVAEVVTLYKQWDEIGYYPAQLHFLWLLGGIDY